MNHISLSLEDPVMKTRLTIDGNLDLLAELLDLLQLRPPRKAARKAPLDASFTEIVAALSADLPDLKGDTQ